MARRAAAAVGLLLMGMGAVCLLAGTVGFLLEDANPPATLGLGYWGAAILGLPGWLLWDAFAPP